MNAITIYPNNTNQYTHVSLTNDPRNFSRITDNNMWKLQQNTAASGLFFDDWYVFHPLFLYRQI